jgi:hypothetical protein
VFDGFSDSGEEKSFGAGESSEAEQLVMLTIRQAIAATRVIRVKKREYRVTLVLKVQFQKSVSDILAIWQ